MAGAILLVVLLGQPTATGYHEELAVILIQRGEPSAAYLTACHSERPLLVIGKNTMSVHA